MILFFINNLIRNIKIFSLTISLKIPLIFIFIKKKGLLYFPYQLTFFLNINNEFYFYMNLE